MNTTTENNTPTPSTPEVHRPVLKCECGGLYRNPDAHYDAFGHKPEPVYADFAYEPASMFDPSEFRFEPLGDAVRPRPEPARGAGGSSRPESSTTSAGSRDARGSGGPGDPGGSRGKRGPSGAAG